MPRSEKQRLRRKAKARHQRLHPHQGSPLAKVPDVVLALEAKVRP